MNSLFALFPSVSINVCYLSNICYIYSSVIRVSDGPIKLNHCLSVNDCNCFGTARNRFKYKHNMKFFCTVSKRLHQCSNDDVWSRQVWSCHSPNWWAWPEPVSDVWCKCHCLLGLSRNHLSSMLLCLTDNTWPSAGFSSFTGTQMTSPTCMAIGQLKNKIVSDYTTEIDDQWSSRSSANGNDWRAKIKVDVYH